MITLVLDKNGIITLQSKDTEDTVCRNDQVLYYLYSGNFKLVNGFSLRDLFKIFINYPNLQLLDPFISSYVEEYKQCPQIGCVDPRYTHIIVSGRVEYEHQLHDIDYDMDFEDIPNSNFKTMNFKKTILGENEKKTYDFYCSASLGTNDVDPDTNKKIDCYAMDFVNLNHMLDLPIVLELDNSKYVGKIEIENAEHDHQFETVEISSISFFDFIFAIVNEITFHGPSDSKSEILDELRDRMKDVEKEIDRDKNKDKNDGEEE